jgi:hypothetical protein
MAKMHSENVFLFPLLDSYRMETLAFRAVMSYLDMKRIWLQNAVARHLAQSQKVQSTI